ncbi:DNA-binding response regulator [Brevibacillus fluminis]|uniref:DNA-binding response regulator n=1 Tax=Brevibacillus fluminis TaxID=511487 RepID=A0A3M8CUP4_9BACL|nr:response regulator transcription factor [Brevibacillus fluminis]RNB79526.1 DNA-binding response regulator [Brevibacillus fluminis]
MMVSMERSVSRARSYLVSAVRYKEIACLETVIVLVVSDQKLFIDGMRALLQRETDIIMKQASYEQLLQRSLDLEENEPSVVLFDGAGCEDTNVLEAVMQRWQQAKIIVLSPFLALSYRRLSVKMRGVVVTSLRPSSVAQTIRLVISGNWFLPLQVVQRSVDEPVPQ